MKDSSSQDSIEPLVEVLRAEVHRALEELGIEGAASSEVIAEGLDGLIRRGLLRKELSKKEQGLLDNAVDMDQTFVDVLITERVGSVVDEIQETLAAVLPTLKEELHIPILVARGDGVDPNGNSIGAEPTMMAQVAQANVGQSSAIREATDHTILLTNQGGVQELKTLAVDGQAPVHIIEPGAIRTDAKKGPRAVEMGKALQLIEQALLKAAPQEKRQQLEKSARGEDLIGEVLGGKYLVEGRLGRGGFGTVYRAKDIMLDAPVAIKVLNRAIASKQKALEDFLAEAQKLTTLESEHIVRWITFDRTDDGLHYFVMEYLEGRELSDVLEENGPLEPELAGKIILQTLKALETAHDAKGGVGALLHLDLKPQNIFINGPLTSSGVRTKVIDFGISQHVKQVDFQTIGIEMDDTVGPEKSGDSTKGQGSGSSSSRKRSGRSKRGGGTGTLRAQGGTPMYSSPEQCTHLRGDPNIEALDGRSDLYSLGMVAFKLLTGELPFPQPKSPAEAFRQHLNVPPKKVRAVNPKVPRRIAGFVDLCLAKKPDDRWADTPQARSAIEKALEPLISKQFLVTLVILMLAITALIVQIATKTPSIVSASLYSNSIDAGEPNREELQLTTIILESIEDEKREDAIEGQIRSVYVDSKVPDGPIDVYLGTKAHTLLTGVHAQGNGANSIEFWVDSGYKTFATRTETPLFLEWDDVKLRINAEIYKAPNLATAFDIRTHLKYKTKAAGESIIHTELLLYSPDGKIGLTLLDPSKALASMTLDLGGGFEPITSSDFKDTEADSNARTIWFSLGDSEAWGKVTKAPKDLTLKFSATTKAQTHYVADTTLDLKAMQLVPGLEAQMQYRGHSTSDAQKSDSWSPVSQDANIRLGELQDSGFKNIQFRTRAKLLNTLPNIKKEAEIHFGSKRKANTGSLEPSSDTVAAASISVDPTNQWVVADFSLATLLAKLGSKEFASANVQFQLLAGIVGYDNPSYSVYPSLTSERIDFTLWFPSEASQLGDVVWSQEGDFEFGLTSEGVSGVNTDVMLVAEIQGQKLEALRYSRKKVSPSEEREGGSLTKRPNRLSWARSLPVGTHSLSVTCYERGKSLVASDEGGKQVIEASWPAQSTSNIDASALNKLASTLLEVRRASSKTLAFTVEVRDSFRFDVTPGFKNPPEGISAGTIGGPMSWTTDQTSDLVWTASATDNSAGIQECTLDVYHGNTRRKSIPGIEAKKPSTFNRPPVFKFQAIEGLGEGNYTIRWRGKGLCGNSFHLPKEEALAFNINNKGPRVSFTLPAPKEDVVWKADPQSSQFNVQVTLSDQNGVSETIPPYANIKCPTSKTPCPRIPLERVVREGTTYYEASFALPDEFSNQTVSLSVSAFDSLGMKGEFKSRSILMGEVNAAYKPKLVVHGDYELVLVNRPTKDYEFCEELSREEVLAGGTYQKYANEHIKIRSYEQAKVKQLRIERTNIKPFYLGAKEVTNKQFEAFFNTHRKKFTTSRVTQLSNYFQSLPAGHNDMPIELVHWDEANNFAESWDLRLPTALEWELAVRTEGLAAPESPRRYSSGDHQDPASTVALGAVSLKSALDTTISPSIDSTPNGIQHLLGNVCEWTSTPYWLGGYEWSEDVALGNFSLPANPKQLRYMVVGSWYNEVPNGGIPEGAHLPMTIEGNPSSNRTR